MQQPDIHVTAQPTTIQLEHVPGELSDVTMLMDDNGTESIGSNFGDNILSGEDGRTSMSRGGDDRAEGDVVNEKEEDYDRVEEDVVDEEEEDHELWSVLKM